MDGRVFCDKIVRSSVSGGSNGQSKLFRGVTRVSDKGVN